MSNRPPPNVGLRADFSPWNPLNHLRLLWWVFVKPERLHAYRNWRGRDVVKGVGVWLSSVLLWLPLFIPLLGVGIGTIPTAERPIPLWLIGLGVIVGWLLTGALASREKDLTGGRWRETFGVVFSTAFLFALGLAIGIGFSMGLAAAFDMVNIVEVGTVFGSLGVVVFVVAFGLAFGIAIVIADTVAFAGAFIVTPLLAFLVSGQVAFGIGFVGVFLSIFLLTFCIAFATGFAAALVLSPTLARTVERSPGSAWGVAFRLIGLALLVVSYAVLVWLFLLGGWRVMT